MRVPVNPATLEPAGEPEYVVAGRMGDDFCIDEDAQVIYLTTHRQNTIDIVSMDPGLNSGFTQSVAGDPFTYDLIGPSAGGWGRGPDDHGRRAFFLMDGGTASPPPDGVRRPAKLLQIDLAPITHLSGITTSLTAAEASHLARHPVVTLYEDPGLVKLLTSTG